ncbi:MAG TPA: hypothetical protein VF383_08110 [Candidatus Dormibacteraeota bacterium]
MRLIALAALLLPAACSQQPASAPSAPVLATANASPTVSAASCRLPVWWSESPTATSVDVHAAFVSVPSGQVTDVGVISPLLPSPVSGLASVQSFGATFDAAANKWLHADRQLLSPDRKRYAYWMGNGSNNEIHVVDLTTGADRIVYSGSILFIVIAFTQDTLYLVHAINPRQGSFELLFTLDPAGGGTPTLVTGSDRHMYQWGWVLISDGAAWGIDYRVQGNAYVYSMLRLDLTTGSVTQWLEGPPDDMFWPQGTDGSHRLYAGDNQQKLLRIASPGNVDTLANPGPVAINGGIGSQSGFVSDSTGVWFSGQGRVWLYSETAMPKDFAAGPPSGQVWPAGPCL